MAHPKKARMVKGKCTYCGKSMMVANNPYSINAIMGIKQDAQGVCRKCYATAYHVKANQLHSVDLRNKKSRTTNKDG